jgi:hypothetical protein
MTCCDKELESKIRTILNEAHPDSKIGDTCVSKLVELLKGHCPHYSNKSEKKLVEE